MSSGLILAPAANPERQRIFERLVKQGVETDEYDFFWDTEDHGFVHVLPHTAGDIGSDMDVVGSYVLFYTGGNEYTWAAKVRSIFENEGVVSDLLSGCGIARNDRADYSDQYLVLDVPFRIELDSYEIHDQVGLEQDALTRFVTIPSRQIDPIERDFGSLKEYLLRYRVAPTVWIEKTELEERPYKQQGGGLELGTAVFSRSEEAQGHKQYESLRKAEVGDIVFHLLQDRYVIAGVSVVTSTLREDFEGPPDESWPDEARGSGYFRALAQFTQLNHPIDIYDDVLDASPYRPRLQSISEEYGGLFFDKNRELLEGAYFTRCPVPLLHLFIAEAPEILDHLFELNYAVSRPEPIDSYGSTKETVTDVRIRLAYADEGPSWFRDQFALSIIDILTTTLTKVQPNVELTKSEAVHCELIATAYEAVEDDLEYLAEDLGVGRANHVSPAKTLYFVLFRELQAQAGVSTNMNQVKTHTILNENYSVETPRPVLVDPDDVEPLESAPAPRQADDIERQLREAGQMVFYGPPGTSKTYTAQQFAKWWLHQQSTVEPDTSHLKTVTFHPSFSYEDFIEGLSVELTDDDTVAYQHKSGVFKETVERARLDYEDTPANEEPPKYILIIDEINRGNLPQIFGETMTALEYDKRMGQENETTVSLAHTGTPFKIPPNLYVIGTMNTADRSIALVDAALRRRFRFISFPPDYELLYEIHKFEDRDDVKQTIQIATDLERTLLALSIEALHVLNEKILDAPDLGKGKQIGHSYLIDVEDAESLVDAWRFEILPLIEEYHFGQFDRIRDELLNGGGDKLMQWDTEEIKSFDDTALREELSQLVEIPARSSDENSDSTIHLLYEAGIVEEDDELVIKESRVPADSTQPYDESDDFWRCRLTGSRDTAETVEWMSNGQTYSLSGLARTILTEATGDDHKPNGVDIWVHPDHGYRSLWDLREDQQQTEA